MRAYHNLNIDSRQHDVIGLEGRQQEEFSTFHGVFNTCGSARDALDRDDAAHDAAVKSVNSEPAQQIHSVEAEFDGLVKRLTNTKQAVITAIEAAAKAMIKGFVAHDPGVRRSIDALYDHVRTAIHNGAESVDPGMSARFDKELRSRQPYKGSPLFRPSTARSCMMATSRQ